MRSTSAIVVVLRGMLILKHRGLGRECAGRFASRFFGSHSPAYNCFRPLIDFLCFRPWPENSTPLHSSDAENSGNRSNLAMESRALAQKVQLSNDVSPPNPTAVNTVRLTCADSGSAVVELGKRHHPRVFNPRSRVSALLIVARGRGTKRVWLTVAGNRRSATA